MSAYRSSDDSNAQLVENMTENGLIDSARVEQAFKKVDRKNYVLDRKDAYRDAPQPVKCNATISAPHMHAEAVKYLLPFLRPSAKILDVGSGSGYTCALFHHLVTSAAPPTDTQSGSTGVGKVVGIDHMSELVEWSIGNLARDGLGGAVEGGQIEMVTGDGRAGWVHSGPYDAIHVGAAAAEVPHALLDQLARPGRMFVPVGPAAGFQQIMLIDKDEHGRVTEKAILDVMYVPLTDQETQRGD